MFERYKARKEQRRRDGEFDRAVAWAQLNSAKGKHVRLCSELEIQVESERPELLVARIAVNDDCTYVLSEKERKHYMTCSQTDDIRDHGPIAPHVRETDLPIIIGAPGVDPIKIPYMSMRTTTYSSACKSEFLSFLDKEKGEIRYDIKSPLFILNTNHTIYFGYLDFMQRVLENPSKRMLKPAE